MRATLGDSAPRVAETPHRTAQETAQTRVSTVAGRALYGALLVAVAMSPFEAGYRPVGRFVWATFTNLEVVLFALAAAWLIKLALDPQARARLLRLPLLPPMLALIAASALSTIFGQYQAMGLHFIYRLLLGMIVFACVWEAVRSKQRLFTVLALFVAAGFAAAVFGLMEYAPWFNAEEWLMAFKPQPTTVGGLLRLSGTFEYANGAAAYFEMALPVTLGLLALFSSRRLLASTFGEGGSPLPEAQRRVIQIALFAIVGTLAVAILLTFSRAALGGVAVAVGVFALAAIVRGRSRETRWVTPGIFAPIGLALLVMLAGGLYIFITQPMFSLRLTTENDRDWYKATYSAGRLPALTAGNVVTVPVTVRNDGPMLWRSQGVLAAYLSYHWMDSTRTNYVVYDGVRTALPGDVPPGGSATVLATVQAPSKAGEYYLQWDMVQEYITWFSLKAGVSLPPARYEVAQPAQPDQTRAPLLVPHPSNVQTMLASDTSTVQRTALWSVAFEMFKAHPIVGVGPDGFRNLYGEYAGVTSWNKNIYTNNTYIEMFTNLGLLGGLAFLWLVLLSLWKIARNLLRIPVSGLWILGLGASASIMAFFAHGLVDYFLFSTPIYTIFWLLLAVSVCWPRLIPDREVV